VRVRALVSAISRGTESLVFQGLVPETLRDTMRCPFQAGNFPGPVKYGYCLVGVVEAAGEAAGEAAPGGLLGRRVFVLHPHQDRLVVPASACRPVPDGVPTDRAVLAANMETAVNLLWDGGALPGQRIAVVGAGVVGLLTAWLAMRIPGTAVRVVDIDAARAPVAARLGIPFTTPDEALAEVLAETGPCDLVVHTSASAAGLARCLDLAGVEATVVEASWYGDRPVAAPLGAGFHPKRLRLVSSQVGMVAPAMRPRWDHARRLDLALSLLADPALDALLEGESAFADLPGALAHLSRTGGLCHRVRYG
jgi:threonine dehydrogenase-like Zn-dependent dehydrogenase